MNYSIEELIAQGATLKQNIDAATEALREINKQLAAAVPFKDGSKSAKAYGAGYKVKIQLRENTTWSQEKLQQVKSFFPQDQWDALFKTVFEPASKKALDSFLAGGAPELVNGIRWAMTVKPGSPSVTYELVEVDHAEAN